MTQSDYAYSPVPFTQVTFVDNFWTPRLETNRTITIPYDFEKCDETGRLTNFDKAAGRMGGPHEGIYFNDSDVFKIIEAAAYSLSVHPDPELDAYLDDLIERIGASQEEDGYLYTARTIAEANGTVDQLDPDRVGLTRWSRLYMNHELYNVGHMYDAAVAHYQATGKRTYLDIALQNAELIDQVFGPDGIRDVPGHQQIEMGLASLYRTTGNERYLTLAKFFLDERGHANGRDLFTAFGHDGYMQDHLPVIEQAEAVGHSVRAVYMYCAMADVAALTGEQAYIDAIDTLWENVVTKKMYLTGGIGALHHGEAFGANYELPNDTAYTETCASIASAMWNKRMFQLHGDVKYFDVLERTIYNGFLSGISLSGDRFFYSNPLAFDGEMNFNRDDSNVRMPWFSCSCCPSNVVRLLPSLPGYVYAQRDKTLYINLYIAGNAAIEHAGTTVNLIQETSYPWDGQIDITVDPAEPTDFTLSLRIPGWARNQPLPGNLYRYVNDNPAEPTLSVNGQSTPFDVSNGAISLNRRWSAGDVVTLNLPMPVRVVACHDAVEANHGRLALERGPLVYCVEAVDNGGKVDHLILSPTDTFTTQNQPELLGGVTTIHRNDGMMAIPYYAWAHRGVGTMAVWL